jgi:hypothetical protein
MLWSILSSSVLLMLQAQEAEKLSYAALAAKTDYSCILRHWRIRGVGFCIRDLAPRACLKVENPWPVGVFEVTRKEYASSIAEVQPMLTSIRPAMKDVSSAFFKTKPNNSSHVLGPQGGRSTRFAEARVLEYAPPFEFVSGGLALPVAVPCVRSMPLGLRYASELDALGWRNELLDRLYYTIFTAGGISCDLQWPANLHACAGPWGSYYPRVGWANHPSSVISAYVQALRAGRVASEPSFGRIKLGPYPHPVFTGHFFQSVSPGLRACDRIGSPLVMKVEAGNGSPSGGHVLIHFAIFRSCVGCDPCGTIAPPRHF